MPDLSNFLPLCHWEIELNMKIWPLNAKIHDKSTETCIYMCIFIHER